MISFLIPVYNASKLLPRCLSSIRKQNYPGKIEIIIIDGGSTDNTLDIAKQYGCIRLHNPKRLAEYGLQVGMKEARGELVVIFAADNELLPGWCLLVDSYFKLSNISALWGRLAASKDDPPINHYAMLLQSEPLSWFIKLLNPKLLIWGANGLIYRTQHIRPVWNTVDYMADNDSFQLMKERGFNHVAYCNYNFVYHHHVSNLIQWARKFSRNFSKHYLEHKSTRHMGWLMSKSFNLGLLAWVIYTLTPCIYIHSAFLAIKQKSRLAVSSACFIYAVYGILRRISYMEDCFCAFCLSYTTCIIICSPLEKRLNERDIAGYSKSWKKRKEVLFPTYKLEQVAHARAFQLKFGKFYFKNRQEE